MNLKIFRKIITIPFVKILSQTLAAKGCTILISVLVSVVTARCLGPAGRGILASASAVTSLGTQIGNLGLPSANIFFVAKKKEFLPSLIGNSLAVSFIVGCFSSLVVFLLLTIAPQLIPLNLDVLMLAIIMIPFSLGSMLFQNLLLGVSKVNIYNKLNIIGSIIIFLSILFLAFYGKLTPFKVVLVNLFSAIVIFCLTFLSLTESREERINLSGPIFKKSVGFGVKAYLANFFAAMVFKSDILMIGYFLHSKDVGYYSISIALCNLLYIFPGIVGTLIFPKLSASSDEEYRLSITIQSAKGTAVIMLLICSLVYVAGKYGIKILYGKKFIPSFTPLAIMLPGIFLWSIESIFRKYLNTDPERGFRVEVVILWLIVMVLNIVLNMMFIPVYGINGAALCSLISLTLAALGTMVICLIDNKKRASKKWQK